MANNDLNRKEIKSIEIHFLIILSVLVLISGTYLFIFKNNKDELITEPRQTISIDDTILEVDEDIQEVSIGGPIIEEDILDTTYDDTDRTYADIRNLNFNNLDESSWLISYEDGTYKSIIGLDISEFNGNVNFYTLKDKGIDFVMLRVGWRGYTEGGIYKDNYFEDYYGEALDAGLNIGYYFFSQAISIEEAIQEADFVLKNIDGKKCNMFIAYDMESTGQEEGRIYYLSKSQRTSIAKAFMDEIIDNGYNPILYTNNDWATRFYDLDTLHTYPIWYAQYDGYPDVDFTYTMWQYTSSATISGVPDLKGMTDLNLMLIEK